jgi:hypothetical protein
MQDLNRNRFPLQSSRSAKRARQGSSEIWSRNKRRRRRLSHAV